jgi:RNA polymerase sigma-70 factor (ECF subfamily)
MEETLDEWFAREILVYERSLMRYLARVWPNREEISDLRQEIYANIFESAMRAIPTAPKAFLFTSARHLMTDRLRRRKIVLIGTRGDLDAMNVLVDDLSPEHHVTALQELGRLAQAFDSLPPRCRQVTWLRKVEQLPQKEVAARLGIREKAVEKQVSRGMRLLARALLEGVETGDLRGADDLSESESEHG